MSPSSPRPRRSTPLRLAVALVALVGLFGLSHQRSTPTTAQPDGGDPGGIAPRFPWPGRPRVPIALEPYDDRPWAEAMLRSMGSDLDLDSVTAADVVDFRDQVDTYMDGMHGLYPKGIDLTEMLGEPGPMQDPEDVDFLLEVADMFSDNEIVVLQEALTISSGPEWWALPAALRGDLDDVLASAQQYNDLYVHVVPELPALPDLALDAVPNPTALPTPQEGPSGDIPQREGCSGGLNGSTCPDCPLRIPTEVLWAFRTIALAADFVQSIFSDDILFVFTTNGPNPFKLALTAVAKVANFVQGALTLGAEIHAECEQNYHRGLTHYYLDFKISQLAAENALEFHDLQGTRLEIEHDLLRIGDDPFPGRGGRDAVLDFVLPVDAGGYLEEVRFIVQDTIYMTEIQAGETVHEARAFLAAGDAAWARGEVWTAYGRYRDAYLEAVKSNER